MKSFKQYLLEFDPNRGAEGRAIPILNTPTERTNLGIVFPGGESRAKAKQLGLRTTGKKDKRYEKLSPEGKEQFNNFESGRYFRDRFRGSYLLNPGEDHENRIQRAHEVGTDAGRSSEVEEDNRRQQRAEFKAYDQARKGKQTERYE